MSVQWMVAKYVKDLRRQEPRNIGVVLRVGDEVLSRFHGEREDGVLDGRSLWRDVGSVQNYKAWIAFWRSQASRLDPTAELSELSISRGDDNYVLHTGGEVLAGDVIDADAFLDELFETLVADARPEHADEEQTLEQASESLIGLIGLAERVSRLKRISVPNTSDVIRMDYDVRLRERSLVRRIYLGWEDDRSWDTAHAAGWDLRVAREHKLADRLVALVRLREADADLEGQLDLIGEYATPVDVDDEATAISQLTEAIGV